MRQVEARMDERCIRAAYAAYSRQDLPALLGFVADDVDWPDGERRLHGHAEVADYWRAQWSRVLTVDEPVDVVRLTDRQWVVRLDQVVCTTGGELVSTGFFLHVLHTRGDMIARLDIVPLQTDDE